MLWKRWWEGKTLLENWCLESQNELSFSSIDFFTLLSLASNKISLLTERKMHHLARNNWMNSGSWLGLSRNGWRKLKGVFHPQRLSWVLKSWKSRLNTLRWVKKVSKSWATQQFTTIYGLISNCDGEVVWEIQFIHLHQNRNSHLP